MWTARLRPLIEEHGATFFEATTAMAFADFARAGREIAVVEVGLGGRLDSTNVLQPLVSVVTKIEVDHVKYLGDTLELIAGEKAGIAKPGAPFVIGEARPRDRRGAASRGPAVRQRGSSRGRPSTCGRCRRMRSGRVRCGSRDRTSGGTPRWPWQRSRRCPAPGVPTRARSERGFAEAFIAGRLDRRGR